MADFDMRLCSTKPGVPGTVPITAEGVLASVKTIKECLDSLPKPEFDCVVCSSKMADRIRARLGAGSPGMGDPLVGIPLYEEPTDALAHRAALRLRDQGKRPLLVMEE